MPSLLDIAPVEIASEVVSIRGTELTLRGLSALEIAKLLRRFEDLRLSAAGRLVDEADMLCTGLEASPAIIAAGLGNGGSIEIEKEVSDRLTPDEQKLCIDVIMRLTNPPEPAGPSVPSAKMAASVADGVSGRAAGTA